MTKRKAKRRRREEAYEFLGIEVQGFEVNADISLNWNLTGNISMMRDEDLAHWYITTLEITGVCTSPPERGGDAYLMRIHGC